MKTTTRGGKGVRVMTKSIELRQTQHPLDSQWEFWQLFIDDKHVASLEYRDLAELRAKIDVARSQRPITEGARR